MRPGRDEQPRESDEDSTPTYTDRDPADESTAPDGPRDDVDSTGEGISTGPPQNAAVPVEQHVARPGTAPAEPMLRILPLGTGLILIGLGLGMAFLALRLRRD